MWTWCLRKKTNSISSTLNGLRHVLRHDSEGMAQRDESEYATKLNRTRIQQLQLRVGRSPDTRTLRDGTYRRGTLSAVVVGTDTLPEASLSVTQTPETN